MNATTQKISKKIAGESNLAQWLVQWQRQEGRHHLPWQNTHNPYRVWLSEIMLQQTQVSTVLNYYERFLSRFPTVHDLAKASQEDVLGLWSGLGYYSRARNLHACAQIVVNEHGGIFPQSSAQLAQLPGIGASTAAAIAAFCFHERAAILDGNVKRVLSRFLAFSGDLSQAANVRLLWSEAEKLLPIDKNDMPSYTQGLMDLGATICTTRKPSCLLCPLMNACQAKQNDCAESLPIRTRKMKRKTQNYWLLFAFTKEDNQVWLEKRPQKGIWAGLHCLPMFESIDFLRQTLTQQAVCDEKNRQNTPNLLDLLDEKSAFLHVLTHLDLNLHPVFLPLSNLRDHNLSLGLLSQGEWVSFERWQQLGLPAPIRKLLNQYQIDSA